MSEKYLQILLSLAVSILILSTTTTSGASLSRNKREMTPQGFVSNILREMLQRLEVFKLELIIFVKIQNCSTSRGLVIYYTISKNFFD